MRLMLACRRSSSACACLLAWTYACQHSHALATALCTMRLTTLNITSSFLSSSARSVLISCTLLHHWLHAMETVRYMIRLRTRSLTPILRSSSCSASLTFLTWSIQVSQDMLSLPFRKRPLTLVSRLRF